MSDHILTHGGPKVAVFGPGEGNSSLARVTRGMVEGLKACERFGGFVPLENHTCETLPDLDAEIGVLVGPPELASLLASFGDFKERWLFIAANSSWLPAGTMQRLETISQITGYVAPSTWAKAVTETHTNKPVFLWRHGVDAGFGRHHVDEQQRPEGFHLLHLTSSYGERKGTHALIRAWHLLRGTGGFGEQATLTIIADGGLEDMLQTAHEAAQGDDSIRLMMRLNLPVEDMARLYQQFTFICQPSRAEGFGMVPLEARCCGVPVVMTACTGHADHVNAAVYAGVCVVKHGDLAPIDDGPDALAPAVEKAEVALGLQRAYARAGQYQQEALEAADKLRKTWSWGQVTRTFLQREVPRLTDLGKTE